jgi:tetratricopeptide (TPR) repeat protein
MTEELTTDLAKISALSVISRTSAVHYKGTAKTLPQIAQELGVDAVIIGTVQRSGNRVRVSVQLVEARTDRHLWAESYERDLRDVLALQGEVAGAIAEHVRPKLTPQEHASLASSRTVNPEAYEAYLRAEYHLQSALDERADADATIAQAEQAIALDPDFAEAYVTLAHGCSAKIFQWAGGKDLDEKAFVALGRALALNPNLADAYAARGSLYYTRLHNFDIASAIADYRRAVALNPNLAIAHHLLGSEFTHFGLHDKGIEEFRIALRLDPRGEGTKMRMGRPLWQSGRFAEALENYDRYNVAGFEKALTLAYLGRRPQAWETIEALARGTDGDVEDIAAVRAFLYATESKPAQAESQIKISAPYGKRDHFHHAAFILAAACAEMSKPHEAVAWLKVSADGGMPNYPLFHDNPSMRKLQGDPQYERFMSALKLRWDQIAATM